MIDRFLFNIKELCLELTYQPSTSILMVHNPTSTCFMILCKNSLKNDYIIY